MLQEHDQSNEPIDRQRYLEGYPRHPSLQARRGHYQSNEPIDRQRYLVGCPTFRSLGSLRHAAQ